MALMQPLLVDNPDHPLPEVQTFARQVLQENIKNLTSSTRFDRRSFATLYVMYVVLFVVGVGTAVAAVARSFFVTSMPDAVATLAFAGLSSASFFALFLVRPLESLERNSIFSSWLLAVMNTYWTRLMYFTKPETIDHDLKDATDELVANLSALADKHAAAISKYGALVTAPTPAQPTAPVAILQAKHGGSAAKAEEPIAEAVGKANGEARSV